MIGHDFYADKNILTAQFADLPDYRFVIPVGVRSSDALRLSGAIDLISNANFTVTASFENDIRRGADRGSAKLQFGLAF